MKKNLIISAFLALGYIPLALAVDGTNCQQVTIKFPTEVSNVVFSDFVCGENCNAGFVETKSDNQYELEACSTAGDFQNSKAPLYFLNSQFGGSKSDTSRAYYSDSNKPEQLRFAFTFRLQFNINEPGMSFIYDFGKVGLAQGAYGYFKLNHDWYFYNDKYSEDTPWKNNDELYANTHHHQRMRLTGENHSNKWVKPFVVHAYSNHEFRFQQTEN